MASETVSALLFDPMNMHDKFALFGCLCSCLIVRAFRYPTM